MILGVDGGYILLAVNEIKEGTREQFSDVFLITMFLASGLEKWVLKKGGR